MNNSTKRIYTYLAVNVFAEKKEIKNYYLLKRKFFLFAASLAFGIGCVFAQQNEAVDNSAGTDSGMTTISNYSNLRIQTNKNIKNISDASECLEVTGSFDGSIKDCNGTYTVKLIVDNKVIETKIVSIKRSFVVVLKKDLLYTIKVEKEGYLSKIISISTKQLDSLDERNSYTFSFETNLLSKDLQGSFDDDDLDFPVALISYSKKCDCFEHNKEYTASLIQRMINNLFFGSSI